MPPSPSSSSQGGCARTIPTSWLAIRPLMTSTPTSPLSLRTSLASRSKTSGTQSSTKLSVRTTSSPCIYSCRLLLESFSPTSLCSSCRVCCINTLILCGTLMRVTLSRSQSVTQKGAILWGARWQASQWQRQRWPLIQQRPTPH
jgi:hypothetical protein